MMSTEEAEAMVAKKLEREAEPAQPETPKGSEAEPSKPESSADEPKVESEPEKREAEEPKQTEKEEPKADESKDKPEENKDNRPPKQKYSHEERIAHQFAREKQKRKEQREKYQARIKELEAEIEKFKGLKLEDFGENGTGDYLEYKLKERDMQNEVKNTKERIEREEAEEAEREIERRVNLSFPTAEERDEYNDLLAENGQQFFEALQKADPKGVVLEYLNGVEKYPVVLKKLMTDMEALTYVFRDKDPYELRHNLHQFTKELLEGKPKPKEEPVITKQPEPVKPAIPVIGKQVTAQGAPSEPVHDRAYWNEYLRKHPMG